MFTDNSKFQSKKHVAGKSKDKKEINSSDNDINRTEIHQKCVTDLTEVI